MDHYSHGTNMSWNNHLSQLSRTHSLIGSSGSCLHTREPPRTNLIVNYLPNNMTENDLYALFVTIGPVESCRVMRDIKTGYSYGFGFVNYITEEHASRAIATLNGYQVQNKRLKVSFARPAGEDIKDTNLYVTNLPRTITEYQLDVIFGKYGNIVQKHILRDKLSGMPKGIAFVRYDKREEAQEAISALNNVIPDGGSQPLGVRLADEHNGRGAKTLSFGAFGGGPSSYYSGSALSLTGPSYGASTPHSYMTSYGNVGSGGLGSAYRAGYTGSLNRGEPENNMSQLLAQQQHNQEWQQLLQQNQAEWQQQQQLQQQQTQLLHTPAYPQTTAGIAPSSAAGFPAPPNMNFANAANGVFVPDQQLQQYIYGGGYISYYN